MDFRSLSRLIERVREIAPGHRILVFGSSSLFASFSSEPPGLIGVESTLDADFFLEPDDESFRALLAGELGRNQEFHLMTGFYGDFVDLRLAEDFPEGWRRRLVRMPGFDDVFALDPVDMCVTKIAATANARLNLRLGRGGVDRGMKDINTIVLLLKANRIDRATLAQRLDRMDYPPALTVECSSVFAQILALADEPPLTATK